MDTINFIDFNWVNITLLLVVGFIGGMVSGFIGSGGAFVLTPAMMSFGVSALVAVATNICHKFPKALVAAIKRNKYGQVDVKLGLVMGIFAELGMIYGKSVMTGVREVYGKDASDLYVSVIFVVVVGIVGIFVFRDARKLFKASQSGENTSGHKITALARWVQSVHIPGTMIYFRSLQTRVSVLFIVPLGFATGMLAATIAVGGFIGVPAMIYVLGAPALMASASELVIAFVMGLGGALLYSLDGVVDVRLAMVILAGSLFGVQVGAIGTTYVKDYTVKLVMGTIMIIALFSRFFYLPNYLSNLGWIAPLTEGTKSTFKLLGDLTLAAALTVGTVVILVALYRGIALHRKQEALATKARIEE